jgi:hypothetical protein
MVSTEVVNLLGGNQPDIWMLTHVGTQPGSSRSLGTYAQELRQCLPPIVFAHTESFVTSVQLFDRRAISQYSKASR